MVDGMMTDESQVHRRLKCSNFLGDEISNALRMAMCARRGERDVNTVLKFMMRSMRLSVNHSECKVIEDSFHFQAHFEEECEIFSPCMRNV